MTLEAVLERHLNHGEASVPMNLEEWRELERLVGLDKRVEALAKEYATKSEVCVNCLVVASPDHADVHVCEDHSPRAFARRVHELVRA